MSMKATIRQVDSVTVVDVSGRITLGEGCTQLRELIRDQLSKGNKNLLLNLAMSPTSIARGLASW